MVCPLAGARGYTFTETALSDPAAEQTAALKRWPSRDILEGHLAFPACAREEAGVFVVEAFQRHPECRAADCTRVIRVQALLTRASRPGAERWGGPARRTHAPIRSWRQIGAPAPHTFRGDIPPWRPIPGSRR